MTLFGETDNHDDVPIWPPHHGVSDGINSCIFMSFMIFWHAQLEMLLRNHYREIIIKDPIILLYMRYGRVMRFIEVSFTLLMSNYVTRYYWDFLDPSMSYENSWCGAAMNPLVRLWLNIKIKVLFDTLRVINTNIWEILIMKDLATSLWFKPIMIILRDLICLVTRCHRR